MFFRILPILFFLTPEFSLGTATIMPKQGQIFDIRKELQVAKEIDSINKDQIESLSWSTPQNKTHHYGYTTDTYWGKFKIAHNSENNLVVEVGAPLEGITFYTKKNSRKRILFSLKHRNTAQIILNDCATSVISIFNSSILRKPRSTSTKLSISMKPIPKQSAAKS